MDQTDTQSSKPKQADSEGETHVFLFGSHAWQSRSDKPTWCYLPSTAVQTRNVTELPGEHSKASSFFSVERLQTHCDVGHWFVDYCFKVWDYSRHSNNIWMRVCRLAEYCLGPIWATCQSRVSHAIKHYLLYFFKPRPQVGNWGNKSREKKGWFSHKLMKSDFILKPGELTPSRSRHSLFTFRKNLSTFFKVNGGDQKILKEREVWSFNHSVVRNNTKSKC